MRPTSNVTKVPPTREAAILLRRGLSTVVHDLVGIASAIELRLEVVESVIPPSDGAALKTLVQQLRAMTRTIRLLQGPAGSGVLAPSRHIPLDEWWSLVSSLTHGVLPRGVTVGAQVTQAPIPFPLAGALTQIWLLACEELAERLVVGSQNRVIALTALCPDERIELSASLPADQMGSSKRGLRSRWQRQALRIGEPLHADLHWWVTTADAVSWRCSIPVV